MLAISESNREEIENEFLALVLNKNEVIDLLQIKPKLLKNPKNKKMLDYAIECYKNHKIVMPTLIAEVHKDFDVDYYVELLNNELWYPTAWKKQLEVAQESILKFYKEDYIKITNDTNRGIYLCYNNENMITLNSNGLTISNGDNIITLNSNGTTITNNNNQITLDSNGTTISNGDNKITLDSNGITIGNDNNNTNIQIQGNITLKGTLTNETNVPIP